MHNITAIIATFGILYVYACMLVLALITIWIWGIWRFLDRINAVFPSAAWLILIFATFAPFFILIYFQRA